MKKYSKQIWRRGFILTAAICLSMGVKAQPNPGEDPDAPIDGGVSLLVAAGIGYGIKKVKDNRKKKSIGIL